MNFAESKLLIIYLTLFRLVSNNVLDFLLSLRTNNRLAVVQVLLTSVVDAHRSSGFHLRGLARERNASFRYSRYLNDAYLIIR